MLLPFAILANGLPPDASFCSFTHHHDTVKYRGYRLELTDFKLIKEKNDWLKISFTIVNSGRMNVDLGRAGTEHWVVFNFDRSIFKAKLGGYRENIKRQLVKEKFKLDATKRIIGMELKIPNVLPLPPQKNTEEPVVDQPPRENPSTELTTNLAWEETASPVLPDLQAEKELPRAETVAMVEAEKDNPEDQCPDIWMEQVKIIEEDDKWATLQYTLTNSGTGVVYLFGENAGKKDNLVLHAYLSGVTTLTRGAIPVGGKVLTEEDHQKRELLPGESLNARIKVDIRKKTRYMKSLILSAENKQYASECDRTNNSMGVVLQ